MGLSELFSDVISSLGFAEAQAEAPPTDDKEESSSSSSSDDSEQDEKTESSEGEESGDANEEGGEEEEAVEQAEEEEEEEEPEEEEPEDIKPKLEEECANSTQCKPAKHHFDECVERVTRQQEDPDAKGPKEDCVEEFFHLQHCATQCAAPKLFRELK